MPGLSLSLSLSLSRLRIFLVEGPRGYIFLYLLNKTEL